MKNNIINNKVTIPSWVFNNNEFLIRTVQGLFDTDGCVYRKYDNYAQIEFKFGCFETTNSVCSAIRELGFNPTKIQKQKHTITGKFLWRFYLCRQKEIDHFFKLVEPKNKKHIMRFKKIRSGDTGIRTQICG